MVVTRLSRQKVWKGKIPIGSDFASGPSRCTSEDKCYVDYRGNQFKPMKDACSNSNKAAAIKNLTMTRSTR